MSELSTVQLAELAARVNERRAEFGPQMFDPLSPGEVRLLYDAVLEWRQEKEDGGAHVLWKDGPTEIALADGELVERWRPMREIRSDQLSANGHAPIDDPPAIHAPITPVPLPSTLAEVDAEATAHHQPPPVAPPAPVAPDITPAHERSPAHQQKLDHMAHKRKVAQGAREREARKSERPLPTREEFLAEVKRQAMGGVVPTMKVFDDAKPAVWASAWAHMQRLGLKDWSEVAELCGLEIRRNPRPT